MVADNSQSMSVSWSPYGKILTNTKAGGASLAFGYNAMQQRVVKRVVIAGDTTRTYYIRDAQGNTMGVYTRHNDSVSWREQYILGSSRLGLYRADTLVNKGLKLIEKLYEGKRNYELTNHLGNVMAVINDRKTDSLSGALKVGYNAVVVSAVDYFPFGMAIDSRSYTSSLYRFGFNGKENDKETGEIDFGDRLYDPRIGGRFLSIDFSTKKYPSNSPYSSFNNNPIIFVDPDGNDNVIYILTLPNVPKLLVDKAIANANAYLRIMGLKTTVVRAEANFDISKVDATDGLLLIGNHKIDVAKFAQNNKYLQGTVDPNFLDKSKGKAGTIEDWTNFDSQINPEVTARPKEGKIGIGVVAIDKLEETKKDFQDPLNITKGFKSSLKNVEQLLGLIIVHAAGHEAGQLHETYMGVEINDDKNGFMGNGNALKKQFLGFNGTLTREPLKSVEQLFTTDTSGNRGMPRTDPSVVDKLKNKYQPNNQEPRARANEKN